MSEISRVLLSWWIMVGGGGCSYDVLAPPFKLPASPRFLICGQSNSVSPGQGSRLTHYSTTGRVTVNDFYHGNASRIPTVGNPMDSSIAWIFLGDLLNRDVEFYNIGRGNQSTTAWITTHTEALLVPALQARTYDAVLWHQGESDWSEGIDAGTSYANMKAMILRSREIQPGIPWFVAWNSMKNAPDNTPIRNAQKRIVAEGLAIRGPDTDVLRLNAAWVEASGAEFVGDGLEQHGLLWFEVLKRFE